MGYNTRLYIGPYVLINGCREEEISKSVNTCSNINCEVYKLNQPCTEKQKFCIECGSPFKEKKYKDKIKLSASNCLWSNKDFIDELAYTDQMLGESSVWISNQKLPFRKSLNGDENFDLDLTTVNYQKEIDWFKEKYAKIFDYIQSEFGNDSIEIKWGVVKYYS